MRRFNIENKSFSSEDTLPELIQSYFGPISYCDPVEQEYVIDEPEHDILEKVVIDIDTEDNYLNLHFEEVSVERAKKNNLLHAVPDAINAKNAFLNKVTGKTVADRKKEWREDVLPLEEDVVRFPNTAQ